MPYAVIACCALFAVSAVSARDFDVPDHLALSEQQHRAAIARLWQGRQQHKACENGDCPHQRHTRSISYEEPEYEDYPEETRWMKRSQPSPYISLGALSNLPQFFSELRGTMGVLGQQREEEAHQAQQSAVDADRAFRPPSTAAFLNAFRNYRPLRRTRSFPPALVHG